MPKYAWQVFCINYRITVNLGIEILHDLIYNTLRANIFLNEQVMSYTCNKVRNAAAFVVFYKYTNI